jgi:conjugal transfer mating pair stabilization protein TraN
MLYKYFNGCPEEEESTPMKIKEKKCFYSYKKPCDKFLGICKNKHTDYYCCYPSTLSRIIMEQAIRQSEVFGRSWNPESWGRQAEECRGLTIEEVSKVDFSLIDLSEWLTMMTQANTLPDGTETLEELTGGTHYANPYGRSDLIQRQKDRGVEELNEKLRKPSDEQDIYNQLDCSKSPNVKGCKYGIFQD